MKQFPVFRALCVLWFFVNSAAFSQEALKSFEEEYYDFLALRGLTERPYLNYRTLSDSVWTLSEETPHPWQNQNLGKKRGLFGAVLLKIYGPELFMSANTAAPYGQNDGALWQGKGVNASLSGGLRLEGYGLELTFKPQLAFSQNLGFDIITPAYSGADYAGKAAEYGYYGITSVDAPQRFGDKPLFTYDWGDSEVRYTWKTLTIGFGTQAIWLGPAYLNPILHSNNAAAYPKLDMGLRKQPVTIPWINWYMGDIEFRLWTGYLSESKYFDNDSENDHTMFHGLSFAYAPSFLPGLTLSANRVCLVAWEWQNMKHIFPSKNNTNEDQKASFGLSYFFPQVGLEVFGELGIDDFVPGLHGLIRYPFHTMVYTTGLKKGINIAPQHDIYGELVFEWNVMEMSQDFQFMWPYTFYSHHDAMHGYTNKGQWLGNASSPGGNSQYLFFKIYYQKGIFSLFLQRNNPDNNFLYGKVVHPIQNDSIDKYIVGWKANLVFGINSLYYFTSHLAAGCEVAYNFIENPLYFFNKEDSWYAEDVFLHNFVFQLSAKYSF
jgi:hypothetical protein